MKIEELDQHCGDCGVTEYCGTAYGYSICCDERFGDIEESEYKEIAEAATDIKEFNECSRCDRPDCGIYRYSDDNFADKGCEYVDEARDYYCEQIATYVEKHQKGGNQDEKSRKTPGI